jgi:hypothetical protein
MATRIDPSELASTKLFDEFKRYWRIVSRQLGCISGSGASLEAIMEWGKEFVEYFISIRLHFLSDAILMHCNAGAPHGT